MAGSYLGRRRAGAGWRRRASAAWFVAGSVPGKSAMTSASRSGRREAVAGQASRQRKHASPSEEARQGSAQTWHPGEVPLLLDRSRRRSRQRHSLRRRLLLGPRTRRHLLLGPCLHRCLLLLGPRLRRCLLLDPRLRFRRHRVRRPLGAGRTTRSTGSTCSDPANLCAEMDRRRGPKGSFFWAGSKIRWAEPIQPHYERE